MTSTERARKFKASQAEKGLVQFNAWLPAAQHAELKRIVEMLHANDGSTVVSVALQDAKTGRMKGVKLR